MINEQKTVESNSKSAIVTSCKNCVFRVGQHGCVFNRPQKMPHEILDGYVLIHRFCNRCRNSEWASNFLPDQWVKQVKQESQVPCAVIVYCDMNNSSLLEYTLLKLNKQELTPKQTIIVLHNSKLNPVDVLKLNATLKLKSKFTIERILEEDATQRRAIDIAVKRVRNSLYYILVTTGLTLPRNYLYNIDFIVNEQCKSFVLALPPGDIHMLTCSLKLHRLVRGNFQQNIEDKIQEIAQEEDTEHMIIKASDIICGT